MLLVFSNLVYRAELLDQRLLVQVLLEALLLVFLMQALPLHLVLLAHLGQLLLELPALPVLLQQVL
jgi:hypothetical protein